MSDFETDTGELEHDEPDLGVTDEPAVDEPTDEANLYETPEFRDAINGVLRGELSGALQDLFAQQQQQEGPTVDPYGAPDEFQQGLREFVANEIRQAMEPILPTVNEFRDQQSQQQIEAMIDKLPTAKEAQQFLGEDAAPNTAARRVEFMANGYLPDTEARYGGPGTRAVEAALRMAAEDYRNDLKAAHAAGYAARNAELTRRSDTREPVPVGAVESVQIHETPDNEFGALERWLGRNGRLD